MTDSTGQEIEDCWNRIGVRGDRSCEKLAAVTHCRNCGTHARGAAAVMQRPLPHGYRQEWAEYFARQEEEHAERNCTSLVFRIANEWLALPAVLAVTVAEAVRPHPIPHRGGVLAGIVNVKGRLFPCMSLARLMSISEEQAPPQGRQTGKRIYPRLLVAELGGQAYALPVDHLHGIHRHADTDLQAVPSTVNKSVHRYLTGVLSVEDMRIGCLDPELVGYNLAGALK